MKTERRWYRGCCPNGDAVRGTNTASPPCISESRECACVQSAVCFRRLQAVQGFFGLLIINIQVSSFPQMWWSQCSRRLREGVRFKLTNLAAAILMAPWPPGGPPLPLTGLLEAAKRDVAPGLRLKWLQHLYAWTQWPLFIFQTVAAWINKNDSTTSMLKKSKMR